MAFTQPSVCSVPIGAYDVNTEGATLEMENPHPYVDVLVDQFDSAIEDSSQAEDAVNLYRRYLKYNNSMLAMYVGDEISITKFRIVCLKLSNR